MSQSTHPALTQALAAAGAQTRIKSAPYYHWVKIGELNREVHRSMDHLIKALNKLRESGAPMSPGLKAFEQTVQQMYMDPDVNPYTHAMCTEDDITGNRNPIWFQVHDLHTHLELDDPADATRKITAHFHAVNWPELRAESDTNLIAWADASITAMRNSPERVLEDKWLDEHGQRAAETLAYRIAHQYPGQQLPRTFPL